MPATAPAQPGALTLLVTGLGRCGTTLVMRMLSAGGAPVVGEASDFERFTVHDMADPALVAAEVRGRAVKVIEPHRMVKAHPLLGVRPRHAILLSRDPVEQAKSQLNFVRTLAEDALRRPGLLYSHRPDNRVLRRAMTAAIVRDQARSGAMLRTANVPVTPLRFEMIVTDPTAVADRLAFQLRPWWRLDAAAMAAVVRRRDPAWSGSLDLEAAEALAKESGL
jgi:hypothetical protein